MAKNETDADAIKRIATAIVMAGNGQSAGVFIAALSLAIGSFAKRTCLDRTKSLELIDRIATVAKEAALTKMSYS